DPNAVLAAILRKAERLRCRARHSDRDVHSSLLAARTAHVYPQRPELGFRPLSGFLGSFECSVPFFFVGDRFHFQALCDALQVCNAGALYGEWLLSGLSCSVVADQTIGTLLQNFVCEVRLPLDDRGPVLQLARSGK